MKKYILFISAIPLLISACSNPSRWEKDDIEKKLKQVFSNAKTIHVLDSVDSKKIKSDTMALPSPIYKALITEKEYAEYSFIFYFYNSSLKDTSSFANVFRAVMIHDLTAGFGGKKVQYVCGMPQFDETGDRLIVYTVLLDLPKSYDISKRENDIRKAFHLQKVELKDVKLSKP